MTQILIAEDEEHTAAFIATGLRAEGFTTTAVSTGGQALALAGTGDYALLILDLGLADVDGPEVLRRLREGAGRIPVLILTAGSSVTSTVTGFDPGADDYMAKPFRFEELLARVRRRLRPVQGVEEVTALTHGILQLDLCARDGCGSARRRWTCPRGSSRSRRRSCGTPVRC
jgi:DNA-binding response OmpR family regulator